MIREGSSLLNGLLWVRPWATYSGYQRMRFRGLDLNHLVTLETLLSERSLTRAAERHFLTQPAISNALTKLREYFGDDLLVRVGREMERTPFAETLLPALRVALVQLQSVALAKPPFDPSTITRTVRILTSDYVAQVFLSNVIRHFIQLAPNVAITHVPMSAEAIEQFENGEIEAMIRPLGKGAHTLHGKLFLEQWVCVARRDNKAFGETLTAADYYQARHVSPSYRHYIIDTHWEPPDDVVVRPAAKLPFSAIPILVSQTDFIAVLPERLVRMYESHLPLRRIATEPPLPALQMVVHWNQEQTMDAFLMWAMEQLVVVAGQLDT
jgi:LysR family transcriptional regulator, nod-box dependent transcriptional activator